LHFAVLELEQLRLVRLNISAQTEMLLFVMSHIIAMSSVVTNPVLYGWLNTNLKHLFRAMIPTVKNERSAENGRTTAAHVLNASRRTSAVALTPPSQRNCNGEAIELLSFQSPVTNSIKNSTLFPPQTGSVESVK
jgi:hypothetical protein